MGTRADVRTVMANGSDSSFKLEFLQAVKVAIINKVASWLPLKDTNNFPLLKIYQLTLSKLLTMGGQHTVILFVQEK
jgi:hypothetical protein